MCIVLDYGFMLINLYEFKAGYNDFKIQINFGNVEECLLRHPAVLVKH